MPEAQRARLRSALDDFVRALEGDTGTRRGRVRSAQSQDEPMVRQARELLTALDGGSNQPPADTPGRRAALAASPGGEANTSQRAQAMMQAQGTQQRES